ncbi:MAG: xanthine dehydrogenase family protein molybdopterin-binding subunit [Hyphomicrobiaceae bacterium]|nr:xanthine dehydrogenase family protein molybdopterin-binding subunit [Hyphomicrobiaceae bacterium]
MTGYFKTTDIDRRRPRRNADADSALHRRTFLKLSVGAGAGLVLGVASGASPVLSTAAVAADGPAAFNPFVRITPDNRVIVVVKHLDKGQGAATGLATLVADELDAAWAQVTTEFAPADAKLYANLFFGTMGTGGSTAMANSWAQYRQAGATARAMIVAAAAEAWKVPAAEIRIEQGVVKAGQRSATLGELATAAARTAVPASVPPKAPKDWTYIGKAFPRVDAVAKTTGRPIFTQDVRLDGMVTAVIARPPRFGATVKSFDDAKARAVKGVLGVVQVPQGVAVIASGTWPAIKGREALSVTWDESKAETRGTPELVAEYRKLADAPGTVARNGGDWADRMKAAKTVLEAEYVFPFLAHAAMEPMNAVVQVKGDRATLWTGSQLPNVDQAVIGGILGIKPENVSVETLWAGGSFGRRAVPNSDYVADAAAVANAWGKSDPVKLVWTREDDTQGGYYRPLVLHKVKVGLDDAGRIVAWRHTIVGQSILIGTPFEAVMVKDGIDPTVVEGVADTPYAIPGLHVELHQPKLPVPPLWWRSVGHTHTAYVMETMIDEVAKAAGKDALAYRLELLSGAPRQAAVLRLAAEKAGWGTPAPAGIMRGIAVHESFRTHVAQVAEVRFVRGKPKVERVVCAVDCGVPINPDNIRSQIEGGIGYGLGAVMKGKITLKAGAVEQSNFDGYDVLRIDEMPAVEVHIVASTADPTGVGEPGVPPVGPAVANAIAGLTGKRVRELPVADGLKSV